MSRYRFPASQPREMYWSHEAGGCATCPKCGGQLEAAHHAYVLVIRHAGDYQTSVIGNDGGHFCVMCPIVVLDCDEFEYFASLAAPGLGDAEYAVFGIVDLEAVPADKRHLPFSDDANPIPLVRFTNIPKPKASGSSGGNRPRTKKLKNKQKKKKRRR